MCLLCHLQTKTPDICPFDGSKNTLAKDFSDLRALVAYDPMQDYFEFKPMVLAREVYIPENGFGVARNAIIAAEAYLNGQPLPVPPIDPNPPVDPNPSGQQSAPNLPEPLRSIDWGWQVADQLPDTPEHDIRVYFVPGSVQVQSGFERITTTSWSPAERAAAMEVFAQYQAVVDLNFIEVTDLAQADFIMVEYSGDAYGSLGYFELSDSTVTVDGTTVDVNGLGAFNNQAPGWNSAGLQTGGYGHLTLVHEVGHGLGLAHPHDDGGTSTVMDGVSGPYGDTGSLGLNQGVYTAMTYNDGWLDGPDGVSPSFDYGYVGGPMALDIAVLQDTYGANTSTASGNNTYILPDSNQSGTFYTTIWDTGGTDEIVAGGNQNAIIDLRAATLINDAADFGSGGFVSYHAGIFGGLTIANGVTIENASGGGGSDRITGNHGNNVLRGNGGDDVILGLGGTDALYGGAGADRFVFVAQGADPALSDGPIGANTIYDFEDDVDQLQFHFPTQAGTQQGNDVLFDFGGGDTVLVLNITTGALSDDISFV